MEIEWISTECHKTKTKVIGHFQVALNLIMKARLSAKFLL